MSITTSSRYVAQRKIGKRKAPWLCRWIGHQWDCEDPRACKGDHACKRCMT